MKDSGRTQEGCWLMGWPLSLIWTSRWYFDLVTVAILWQLLAHYNSVPLLCLPSRNISVCITSECFMATVSLPPHKGGALWVFPPQWQRQVTEAFVKPHIWECAEVAFLFSERWKTPNELTFMRKTVFANLHVQREAWPQRNSILSKHG